MSKKTVTLTFLVVGKSYYDVNKDDWFAIVKEYPDKDTQFHWKIYQERYLADDTVWVEWADSMRNLEDIDMYTVSVEKE